MKDYIKKGIRIRNRKKSHNMSKTMTKKDEQKGLCRYVSVKWQVIKKINGKYKHVGEHKDKGLQIENKVYLLDGSYKFVNSKSLNITKIYEGVPEWTNDILIKKYEAFKKSTAQRV